MLGNKLSYRVEGDRFRALVALLLIIWLKFQLFGRSVSFLFNNRMEPSQESPYPQFVIEITPSVYPVSPIYILSLVPTATTREVHLKSYVKDVSVLSLILSY